MGDHRANIKIEMEFHGVKDSCDMWVNYSPEGCCGMDQRVIDFFERVYKKGMAKYDRQMAEYEAERNKEAIEHAEKAELERLKAKYESQDKQ